jgi:cytochrome c peroxidase
VSILRWAARRSPWLVGAGLAVSALGATLAFVPRHAPAIGDGNDVRALIIADADSLDAALVALSDALAVAPEGAGAAQRIRSAFRLTRARYKRVEGIVEFYSPALAAALNSRRQEVDDDDAPPPSTIAPSGFPALEQFLFPSVTRATADSAHRLALAMRSPVARIRGLAAAITPTNPQIIEITRLELARVSTLGIAGFDSPKTGEAMLESAEAIDGIRGIFLRTGEVRWPRLGHARADVDSALAVASEYLRTHADFASSDRLTFLAEYAEPAARAIDLLRRASHTPAMIMPRAWRADVPSVYGADAFDPRAYTPLTAPPQTDELIKLGARLFLDPRLSGTGTRSCASCHDPKRAFTDGLPTAASIDRRGAIVARNTPSLINAGLEPRLFADERAASLEDQALEVLRSPAEMGSSDLAAAAAIAGDDRYRGEFARAFRADTGSAISPLHVRQALAAYVRSLVATNSRFDRAVRGDTAAMSQVEKRGFNLFMGKAACGTCHFAPLFSGDTPPLYHASDVEVIGTPASPLQPARLDADSGRARLDHLPAHLRAFKTPSLRNVALTAPYMHHGRFATLDNVLLFYDGGGGLGAGAKIANQTLSGDALHLTAEERSAIVAFLGTLTDTVTGRYSRR